MAARAIGHRLPARCSLLARPPAAPAPSGTENAIRLTGAQNLANKLVIDATNPLDYTRGPRLSLGFNTSAGEQVQALLPSAKVVKAFNTVGAGLMVKPKFSEGRPTMFFAGDDAAAKNTVSEILDAFLWDSVDIGGIDGARLLEAHAMLWITYGVQNNHWTHAFRLMGRK